MKYHIYKNREITYLYNLKHYEENNEELTDKYISGFLMSVKYQTKRKVEQSKRLRRKKKLIISDNGNFSRIEKFSKLFLSRWNLHSLKLALNEKDKNDTIKTILASLYSEESYSIQDIESKQLLIKPHYFIADEELSIPILSSCDILSPQNKPNYKHLKIYQEITLDRYINQKKRLEEENEKLRIYFFCVLHSYDYKSAYLGTKRLMQSEVEGIGLGFGGLMLNNNKSNLLILGHKTIKLNSKLRISQTSILAICIGVKRALKNQKTLIHILGIGSPLMVLLISYIFSKHYLSFDSTSPYKSSNYGVIYYKGASYFKKTTYEIFFDLIHENSIKINSPIFSEFNKSFSHNLKRLKQNIVVPKKSKWTLKQKETFYLKNHTHIEKHFPFICSFSKIRNNRLKLELRTFRAEHNYYILNDICRKANKYKENEIKHREWTFSKVMEILDDGKNIEMMDTINTIFDLIKKK